MNYKQAIEYIHSTYILGSKLGLENITILLNNLGNPQKDLTFIHIAGTNGKGSTCTMTSYILKESGYKTGLFLSPYLENFNERIQINNQNISNIDLAKHATKVKKAIDKMIAQGHNHPTEFEIITAIAILHYSENKVDFVVLEVGLGGRLDATNVIKKSLLTVITSISYDHMRFLGNTLEKIAFEKGSIIKENGTLILYPQSKIVTQKIREMAKEKNANLIIPKKSHVKLIKATIAGQLIKYKNKKSNTYIKEYRLNLLGEHQIYNSLVVLTIIEQLIQKGYSISTDEIKDGFEKTIFTGRFELMHRAPYILIDGAHNIGGIKCFAKNIKKYFKHKKIHLFFGMLADKEISKSLKELLPLAKTIYTLTPDSPRALSAQDMSEKIRQEFNKKSIPLHTLQEAIKKIDLNKKEELYAFVGSLYMIGHARTEINKYLNKTP